MSSVHKQSLEFVVETRILMEMKIENRKSRENIFSVEKKTDKRTFFFYEN